MQLEFTRFQTENCFTVWTANAEQDASFSFDAKPCINPLKCLCYVLYLVQSTKPRLIIIRSLPLKEADAGITETCTVLLYDKFD